ncbi:Cytochrome P450 9e2, partial [Gryllus bimaculatus]
GTDEELAARAPLHSGAHKAQNIVAQLSDDEITAQVLLFFLSGFETTCTLLSFLGYVLAVHPHVQERARREVEEALEDGHTLTYEALRKMKYLDM